MLMSIYRFNANNVNESIFGAISSTSGISNYYHSNPNLQSNEFGLYKWKLDPSFFSELQALTHSYLKTRQHHSVIEHVGKNIDSDSHYGGVALNERFSTHGHLLQTPKDHIGNMILTGGYCKKIWKSLIFDNFLHTKAFAETLLTEDLKIIKKFLHANKILSRDETANTSRLLEQSIDLNWLQTFLYMQNSWNDCYRFNKVPEIVSTHFSSLFKKFLRTPIRCSITVLNGYSYNSILNELMWHRDEPIFHHLRFSIPIVTNTNFKIQVNKHSSTHLEPGYIYSWDTHLPHRMFNEISLQAKRTHLILGFSPWFDFNSESEEWIQNEYFSKIHPIDMIQEGLVFDSLLW